MPATGLMLPDVKPRAPKDLADVAREMNLSAGEEANLREILRESEEEKVRCLFGDKPLADIARDVRAAKDDPEKQQELIQQAVANAMPNLGKLATSDSRRKKKIENLLGHVRREAIVALRRAPQKKRSRSTDRSERESCLFANAPGRVTQALR